MTVSKAVKANQSLFDPFDGSCWADCENVIFKLMLTDNC